MNKKTNNFKNDLERLKLFIFNFATWNDVYLDKNSVLELYDYKSYEWDRFEIDSDIRSLIGNIAQTVVNICKIRKFIERVGISRKFHFTPEYIANKRYFDKTHTVISRGKLKSIATSINYDYILFHHNNDFINQAF